MDGYQVATEQAVKGSPLYLDLKAERDRLRAELDKATMLKDRFLQGNEVLASSVNEAERERDEARAALENLRQEHLLLKERSLETLTERDYAQAEARRLRDLVQRLAPYAIHLGNCDFSQWDGSLSACGCGLFQALTEANHAKTEHDASR